MDMSGWWSEGSDSLEVWRILLVCRGFVDWSFAVMGCHSVLDPLPMLKIFDAEVMI